ncbi:hypothetical protein P153DRAFT_262535, partial [Dothidotthia symphoricarpi CBS 119687]
TPTTTTMQLAEILSDLVSLRVCDPTAALALVSARPPSPSASTSASAAPQNPSTLAEDDADLTRAKDLVRLHYEVREAHRRGELARGLEEARRGVERVAG